MNCYRFQTERGLKQHLWQSASCGRYKSEPRPALASCIVIDHESTWHRRLGYGVESLCINPFMCADPPSYEPYKGFEYAADFDADDEGVDERDELHDNPTVDIVDDVAISGPVFHAMMERIQASKHHAIMVLHHDPEHRNIVNLLKLAPYLESANPCDAEAWLATSNT